MSGGSFEYLCYSDSPRQDLLESMALALETLADEDVAGAQEAAERTRSYIKPHNDPVRNVWRAVEWWRSCDYGEDQVVEALQAYLDEVSS